MESGAIQVRDAAPPLGWTNIVCTQHTGVDVKMQDIHEYTSAFRWHVVVAAVWAVGLPPQRGEEEDFMASCPFWPAGSLYPCKPHPYKPLSVEV